MICQDCTQARPFPGGLFSGDFRHGLSTHAQLELPGSCAPSPRKQGLSHSGAPHGWGLGSQVALSPGFPQVGEGHT